MLGVYVMGLWNSLFLEFSAGDFRNLFFSSGVVQPPPPKESQITFPPNSTRKHGKYAKDETSFYSGCNQISRSSHREVLETGCLGGGFIFFCYYGWCFRSPVNSPVEVGSLSYELQGLKNIWCSRRISNEPSTVSHRILGDSRFTIWRRKTAYFSDGLVKNHSPILGEMIQFD